MWIISSVTDLKTWIANNNPGNLLGAFSGAEQRDAVAQIAAHIRQDDHPAWGTDWAEWLDSNAERFAREIAL